MAAQVAGVHEMVERLRSEWNSRTGQDPFEVSAGCVFLEARKEGACRSILSEYPLITHQELDRANAENEERKRKTTRLVVRSGQDLVPRQSSSFLQIANAPSTAPASFGQLPSATPSPFASSFAAPATA